MRNTSPLLIITDPNLGVVNRITTLLSRLQIKIESISVSNLEEKDVFKCAFVLKIQKKELYKIINKIEKIIGVFCVYVSDDTNQQIENTTLIKIKNNPFENRVIEKQVRKHYAKVVCINPSFFLIEKTGYLNETYSLINSLEAYKVIKTKTN